MRSRYLAGFVCAICAGVMSISSSLAQTPKDGRAVLFCVGTLAQSSNMAWDQKSLEFSLDYARNAQVTNLKSNIATLNAMLVVAWSDAFLQGSESQPRPIGNDERSLAISELKISRNTGAFTMVASSFRDMDVPDGRSMWEGTCTLKGSAEKKF